MKKLLAILISLCMVSAFAVPVFADANSDYIAAVKAYQAQIAAKEAAGSCPIIFCWCRESELRAEVSKKWQNME